MESGNDGGREWNGMMIPNLGSCLVDCEEWNGTDILVFECNSGRFELVVGW